MKEDVIAANLANLRQSVNELKESVDKLNNNSSQQVRSSVSPIDERTVYNSVAKSFPLMSGLFTTALPKVFATVGTMPCRY